MNRSPLRRKSYLTHQFISSYGHWPIAPELLVPLKGQHPRATKVSVSRALVVHGRDDRSNLEQSREDAIRHFTSKIEASRIAENCECKVHNISEVLTPDRIVI